MKGKLLFAAALVAAGVAGTQAVRLTNGSWNVQLLGNYQQVGTNLLAADDVDPATDETEVGDETDTPVPVAFLDFNEGETYTLHKNANGFQPCEVPLTSSEKGMAFTGTSSRDDLGFVQIDNPFRSQAETVKANGATISLWVYNDGTQNNSIWGFGAGQAGYEEYPKLAFEATTLFRYNNGDGSWIDFGLDNNSLPTRQMAMLTLTFTQNECRVFINGAPLDIHVTGFTSGTDNYAASMPALMESLCAFDCFYVGKGMFTGTFNGMADKVGLYAEALSEDEVAALYDAQKDAYADTDNAIVGVYNAYYYARSEYPLSELISTCNTYNTNSTADEEAKSEFAAAIKAAQGATDEDMQAAYIALEIARQKYISVATPADNQVFDMSFLLKDAKCQDNNTRYWSRNGRAGGYVETIPAFNSDTYSGNGISYYDWGPVSDSRLVWQTVTPARTGRYRVTAYVAGGTYEAGDKNGGNNGGLFLFLNDERTAVPATTFTEYTVEADITSTDEDMTLGIYAGADNQVNWAMISQVKLEYVGAIDNEAVKQLITDYLVACKADQANSTASTEDMAAFESAISAAENIDWNSTTSEVANRIYDELVAAHRAYQAVAEPNEGYAFDLSYLLNDAECQDNNTRYWSRNGSASGYVEIIEEFNSDAYSGNGISYWNGSPQSDIKMVWQDTEAVRPGRYRLTAYAAGGTWSKGDVNTGNNGGLFLFLNGGRTAVPAMTFTEYSVETNVMSEGEELSLGLYAGEDNTVTWAMISQVKLEYVGAFRLDENAAYDITENTSGNVTMARSLGAEKWNTFCVPFDMTAEQLADNGITEVVSLSVDDASTAESINLVSAEVTEVKAGMPYLVKVGSDVATISVDGVYVTATAPAAQTLGTVGDYTVTMTGNYSATKVPTGAFFISNNMFYVADESANVNLKGFRAYITLTDDSGEQAQANVRSISIDGNTEGDGTTGIDGMTGEEAGKLVDVYTLSGVKVKGGVKASEALDGLQRGVYIVNGKKIIK